MSSSPLISHLSKPDASEGISQLRSDIVKETVEELVVLEEQIALKNQSLHALLLERDNLSQELGDRQAAYDQLSQKYHELDIHSSQLQKAFLDLQTRLIGLMEPQSKVEIVPLPTPTKKSFFKSLLASHPYFSGAVGAAFLYLILLQSANALTTHSKLTTLSGQAGQVAGVSTGNITQSPVDQMVAHQYPQSTAVIPYQQTVWESYATTQFSLQYPSNASSLIPLADGHNVWFLRNNGFLMRITTIDLTDPTQTLANWVEANTKDYQVDHTFRIGSLGGVVADIAQPLTHSSSSGTYYFIKRGASIIQFWVKDEPAETDDGQRIQHMLDSLTFQALTTTD